MGKIYRLHQGGAGSGWFTSARYGNAVIDQIQANDPNGGKASSSTTSIPSPFARIEVFRTALDRVVKSGQLSGNTSFHKLVSDMLDLAQVIFNQDSFSSRLRITPWIMNSELAKLNNPDMPSHQQFLQTLQLYISQDGNSLNLNNPSAQNWYFFHFDHILIGGTSPATLFCTPANGLPHIKFGDDILFDDGYVALHERADEDFILAFYQYRQQQPNFFNLFKELNEYLNATLAILQTKKPVLWTKIQNLINQNDGTSPFPHAEAAPGQDLLVMGVPWLRKPPISLLDSDFSIKANRTILPATGGKHPLVLQNKFGNPWRYAEGNTWQPAWTVPAYDPQPIHQRILPHLSLRYPYLTISDLMEPYLMRLVFPINQRFYFVPKMTHANGKEIKKHYLLPLKPLFFELFDAEQITEDMVEMAVEDKKVTVRLRIPTTKGKITLERTYEEGMTPNEAQNLGCLVERQLSVTLFPAVKQTDLPHYRLQISDRNLTNDSFSARPMAVDSNGNVQPVQPVHTANKKKKDLSKFIAESQIHVLETRFDFLRIGLNDVQNVLIPKLPSPQQNGSTFHFAVDFGTTNTHIEYSVDGGPPRPFEVSLNETQVATLYDTEFFIKDPSFNGTGATQLAELVWHDLMPAVIGQEAPYKFPQRTVIAKHVTLANGVATYPMADINVPFFYEKEPWKDQTKLETDLKWNSDQEARRKFISVLALMIRNKVLTGGGSLEKTRITWLYPSSMPNFMVVEIADIWKKQFERHICNPEPVQAIQKMSESIAPFYYYVNQQNIAKFGRPSVSIDIGGGTVDVAVIKNGDPVLLTSFRFGGNYLYGSGYNNNKKLSAFIERYVSGPEKPFEQALRQNSLALLLDSFQKIQTEKGAPDIISFLFSIERNREAANIPALSFTGMLRQDKELKLVILLYLGAIFYHLYDVMALHGLDTPENLLFSGTGAKVLEVMGGPQTVQEYARQIFAKRSEKNLPVNAQLISTPKEVTCKGALFAHVGGNIDIGSLSKGAIGDGKRVFALNQPVEYEQISQEGDALFTAVEAEVKAFFKLFFELNTSFSYAHYFGIPANHLNRARRLLENEQVTPWIKEGFFAKKENAVKHGDGFVDETLFFYPLIQLLPQLGLKLIAPEEPQNNKTAVPSDASAAQPSTSVHQREEIFYLSTPSANGEFTSGSGEYMIGSSLYKAVQTSDTEAKLYFAEQPESAQLAWTMFNSVFPPSVCEMLNLYAKGVHTRVNTERPGSMIRIDGKWRVVEKIRIKFV